MIRLLEALVSIGVIIVACLLWAIRCDRSDEVFVGAVNKRIRRLNPAVLWWVSVGFSVLCVAALAWAYQQIPDTWEWRLR